MLNQEADMQIKSKERLEIPAGEERVVPVTFDQEMLTKPFDVKPGEGYAVVNFNAEKGELTLRNTGKRSLNIKSEGEVATFVEPGSIETAKPVQETVQTDTRTVEQNPDPEAPRGDTAVTSEVDPKAEGQNTTTMTATAEEAFSADGDKITCPLCNKSYVNNPRGEGFLRQHMEKEHNTQI
jgi:hypothetical protein